MVLLDMAPGFPAIDPLSLRRFMGNVSPCFEAFNDLVFGFSLSLLAPGSTRRPIPPKCFETTRWATFIVAFEMF
jgi:hypothetical protein